MERLNCLIDTNTLIYCCSYTFFVSNPYIITLTSHKTLIRNHNSPSKQHIIWSLAYIVWSKTYLIQSRAYNIIQKCILKKLLSQNHTL